MNLKTKSKIDLASIKYAYKKILPAQILISLNYYIPVLICSLLAANFVGKNAQAAIAYNEFLNFILISLAGIVGIGYNILAGQSAGKGDTSRTNSIFSTAIMYAIILGIVFSLIVLFNLDLIAQWLQVDSSALYDYKEFVKGWCFIAIPMLLLFVLLTCLQIHSQQKAIIIFIILNLMLGLILGIFLINILRLGSFGVGLTISLSIFLSDIFLIVWIKTHCKNIKFSFNNILKELIGKITLSGCPFAVANLCLALRAIIKNIYVQNLGGVDAMAAFNVAETLRIIPKTVSVGLFSCTILIACVYIGEKNKDKFFTLISYGLKVSFLISAATSLIWIIFAYWGCAILANDQEIKDLAFIICLFTLSNNILYVIVDTIIRLYQSLGKIKFANILYCFYAFIFPVLTMILFAPIIGLNAVWISYSLMDSIFLLFYWVILIIKNKRTPKHSSDLLILDNNFFHGKTFSFSAKNIPEVVEASMIIKKYLKENIASENLPNMVSLACEEIGVDIFTNSCSKKRRSKCRVEYTVVLEKDSIIIQITDNADQFSPTIYAKVMESDDITYHFGLRYIIKNCKEAVYVNALALNNYHLTYSLKNQRKTN